MTIEDFARLTGYNRRTVTGWGRNRDTGTISGQRVQSFPLVVCRLLDAWALTGGPPRRGQLTPAGSLGLLVMLPDRCECGRLWRPVGPTGTERSY